MTARTWDVVVVGARVAGASTAMLFARRGYRVLLLERARFPRDTLSTLYIQPLGVAALRRWGLLDRVLATGCPLVSTAIHQVGDVRLTGRVGTGGCAPRRHLLDPILVEEAVAAGAEFRDGCGVEDVVFEDGRAVGVRTRSGIERAHLVVGADGLNSLVAQRVRAGVTIERPKLTCVYYTFFTDLPAGFEAYGIDGHWAGTVPTNDGRTLVASYLPQSRFSAARTDAWSAFWANLRAVSPELHARVATATPTDLLRGSGNQRNFLRAPTGPGWALVGDAGHHKDSITARGITDAFIQAEALVDSLSGELGDPAGRDEGLRRFAERRDAVIADGFAATLSVARLEPERGLPMLRVVAERQDWSDRFLAVASGLQPSRDLLTEELRARLELMERRTPA